MQTHSAKRMRLAVEVFHDWIDFSPETVFSSIGNQDFPHDEKRTYRDLTLVSSRWHFNRVQWCARCAMASQFIAAEDAQKPHRKPIANVFHEGKPLKRMTRAAIGNWHPDPQYREPLDCSLPVFPVECARPCKTCRLKPAPLKPVTQFEIRSYRPSPRLPVFGGYISMPLSWQ